MTPRAKALRRTTLPSLLMIALCVAYGLAFFAFSTQAHRGLRTQLHDFGHMEQAVWQLTQGNWSMPLSDPLPVRPRIAHHANLVLYPIGLLYALLPFPQTLMLVGVAAVAAGGFVLFRLASTVLRSERLGLAFGALFLINPFLQHAAAFDFHPELLAIPVLFGALLAIEKRKWKLYWPLVALLLAAKEDMAPLVVALGIFAAVRASVKIGAITAAIGAFYLAVLFSLPEAILGAKVAEIPWTRFRHLGGSAPEAIPALLSPTTWLRSVLRPRIFSYMVVLLGSSGGIVAVFAPVALLLAAPHALENVLDASGFQTNVADTYHSGLVAAALLAAAVYGLAKMRKPIFRTSLLAVCVAGALFGTFALSPLPYSRHGEWSDAGVHYDRETFLRVKALVPDDAPIATQNNLGAQFSARAFVTEYPSGRESADYVLFHLRSPLPRSNPRASPMRRVYFGKPSMLLREHVMQAFADPGFGLVAAQDGFYLFRRGAPREGNEAMLPAALADLDALGVF